jgi:hypothetical protein
MNRWRRLLLVALLAFLAAASPAGSAEGFRPVPKFSPGEAVRYRMNVTLLVESTVGPEDDPAAGGQSSRRALDLIWRIESVSQEADGSTHLRAVIEAMSLEPQEWAELAQPEDFVGKSINYRLRPDGTVDDIQFSASSSQRADAPAWLAAWLDLGPESYPGQPDRPLKPGDRWTSTRAREIPGLPRQRETSESEYLRDEYRGAIPCAAILTRYTRSGGDSREETVVGGGRTRTERRVEGEGERLTCHELATGRAIESTSRSREVLRIRVQDISRDRSHTGTPLVLETRTELESHLRVVN